MKGWVQIKLNLRSKGRSKQWSRYGKKKNGSDLVKRQILYRTGQKKSPDLVKRKVRIWSKERSGSIQKKALDLIKRKVQIHSKETLDPDKRMILIDIQYLL